MGTNLDTKHPLYTEFLGDWTTMRDTFAGERTVKEAGETYLSATSGMRLAGMSPTDEGGIEYATYKRRAVFPSKVRDAVESAVGIMHRKPATIEVPAVLQPLVDKMTIEGEDAHALLRRINAQQLTTGRMGLLLDLPAEPSGDPRLYVTTYDETSIINWDVSAPAAGNDRESTSLVVLDESGTVREGFEWETKQKFRVLSLGDPITGENPGVYLTGIFQDTTSFSSTSMMAPGLRGRTLQSIPFVFVNAQDLCVRPHSPPLIGLAQLSLAIYRGEADYRQSLFLQGQDTAVIIGGDPEDKDNALQVGAGAKLVLPIDGDFKMVGVESSGLSEQRTALENDYSRADGMGAKLLESSTGDKASGEALRIRSAAQTATLTQVAMTGAEALKSILRSAAVWLGANPNEVEVIPNTDFAEAKVAGSEWDALMKAKHGSASGGGGLPISDESIHASLAERGLAKFSYEDELEKIEAERTPAPTPEPVVAPAATDEADLIRRARRASELSSDRD